MNKTPPLEIYAKAEELLGVKDAAPKLYEYYIDALKQLKFKSLLDVGCGSGEFLLSVESEFGKVDISGIDLSLEMVKKSRKKGLKAEVLDLCSLERRDFDVITCVYDMINYLSFEELDSFMDCLVDRLSSEGYLICDINTLYGFEEIAVGSFSASDEKKFISIDSDFEDGVYRSEFTLFERSYGSCWRASQGVINQYYHRAEDIIGYRDLELIHTLPLYLFGEKSDKEFLIFQKV
jgi:cyclopropane fatty-acyl-phospholipid synthase-like methyltransferase